MAYYVSSSLDANVAEGPLVIRAGVSPANVDRAVASIDEEIITLITRRHHGEGARRVSALPGRFDSARARNQRGDRQLPCRVGEFFGLGLDYDVRLPDLLERRHAGRRRTRRHAARSLPIARRW